MGRRPLVAEGPDRSADDACGGAIVSGIPLDEAALGQRVDLSERCCGESGTLAVTRPDISTQVRFRKQNEIARGEAALRADGGADANGRSVPFAGEVKLLTSCPSCLQGLSRYEGDAGTQAEFMVVELARLRLGENWMAEYLAKANNGGIERVLL